MKIIHPIFQEPIVLEDDKVCVIQIENKKCYRELLCEILYQSKRLREGNLLITEEGKEFDLGKDIHVITDVLPVDSNQRKILGKLYQRMESTALESDFYLETQQILSQLQRFMTILTDDEMIALDFKDEISLQDLFKIADLKIECENIKLLEKLLDYLEVVQGFLKPKCIIIMGLKQFFEKDELEEIYKFVIYQGIRLVLIENAIDKESYDFEKKLIVDMDLCEI